MLKFNFIFLYNFIIMGALTLKNFPFELRGWDVEKFESLDPTDGFLSNTRVYINKNQIIQIEPDYNVHTFNSWLTDKGRQFFDGTFKHQNLKIEELSLKKNFWSETFFQITKAVYILDHCNAKQTNKKNKFFNIVYDFTSLETISMLNFLANSIPYIKLKNSGSLKFNNDLETNFQLNNSAIKTEINASTLSLLVSTNSRYEGYYLNLNLRQRSLKGNFKCLSIGSLIDLTFPISFLGSTTKILTSIAEGNNLFCQDFKSAKNPILIFNFNLFQRNDSKNIYKNINSLLSLYAFKKTYNAYSFLNSSMSITSLLNLNLVSDFNLKDLNNFNSLYLLNFKSNIVSSFKKILNLKLIKPFFKNENINLKNKFVFNQNIKSESNFLTPSFLFNNYDFIPSSMFYENEESFFNVEGFVKRTSKLVYKKKSRSNWQIFRKLLKIFSSRLVYLATSNNQSIFYNSKTFYNFKNYKSFHYLATQTLTNLSFYLSIKNKSLVFYKNNNKFKLLTKKVINSKLKYWLDDFFSGGKDEYSSNSIVLTNSSKILRAKSATFF